MERGDSWFTLEYKAGRIREFEMEILSGTRCVGFLPMNFAFRPEGLEAGYNSSGFVPLSSWETGNMMRVLEVLERTCQALMEGLGHLIFPEQVSLNSSTVFVHEEGGVLEVRIAYIPKERECISPAAALAELMPGIQDRFGHLDLYGQLPKLSRYLDSSNPAICDVMTKIGEFRRELTGSGWMSE